MGKLSLTRDLASASANKWLRISFTYISFTSSFGSPSAYLARFWAHILSRLRARRTRAAALFLPGWLLYCLRATLFLDSELVLYCLRAVLLLGSGLILYCLRAVLLLGSGLILYCLWAVLLLRSGVLYCLRAAHFLGCGWALYCLRAALLLGSGLVLYCLRASSFIVSEWILYWSWEVAFWGSGLLLLYCLRAVSFALLGSAL